MKYSGYIALIISVLLAAYVIYDKVGAPSVKKVGYIEMDKLVFEYKGMKEATARYEQKLKSWNKQQDSLKEEVMKVYHQLKVDSLAHDKQKLKDDVRRFQYLREGYANYAQQLEAKAGEEDNTLTAGVINQLNEHIKTFAETNGFDVVLCSSPQNYNVGYAREKINITKQVLDFANKAYEGGHN
ncbi:MAG: OmpH family outer membrane protein [Sediminibacterium sp.]|nr:OmpH family outer membrane protein [Sediminibacterium sp.]